jgi:hypothetical protein
LQKPTGACCLLRSQVVTPGLPTPPATPSVPMIPVFPSMAPPGYGGATTCSAAYTLYCNAYPATSNAALDGFLAE